MTAGMIRLQLIRKAYELHARSLMSIHGVWSVMPSVDRLIVYADRSTDLTKIPDSVIVDGQKVYIQTVIADKPSFLQ